MKSLEPPIWTVPPITAIGWPSGRPVIILAMMVRYGPTAVKRITVEPVKWRQLLHIRRPIGTSSKLPVLYAAVVLTPSEQLCD